MTTIPLTQAQFTLAKQALASKGVVINEDAGVLEHGGTEVKYDYDGSELTYTCDKAPFHLEGHVESEIKAWIEAVI